MVLDSFAHDDLKSLRAIDTVHSRTPSITRRLFRCVRLSPLVADYTALVDLSHRPYLVEHVEAVAWIAFPTTIDSFLQ